jgi:L-amino acid N-acyltransferase YncA
MDEKIILFDGMKIVIRELKMQDLSNLLSFYRNLSEEDRRFLRVDVTKKDVVKRRLDRMLNGEIYRIIALKDKEIIADGALELSGEDWRKNQAELRVIVAKSFRRKGLGIFLMKELNDLAVEKDVKLLVIKMMKPQLAARKISQRLGFRKKMIIPRYVVDMHGQPHDLLIMTRNVKDLMKDLNHLYQKSDWQRCR